MAIVSIPARLGGATPDVSWLIDMCARILDGEKAYIDIFETTPPIPTLLYMPGAFLSKLTGWSAEAIVYAYSYTACALTFALCKRILPDPMKGVGDPRWTLLFPAAAFLFILSTDAFAQREFFSAVFSLPIIFVLGRFAIDETWPDVKVRVLSGLLCGLAVAIKPPLFALPIIGAAIYLVALKRDLRAIYASGLIFAAFVSIALTIVSLAAFPEYLDGVSVVMRDVYVPWRYNHPLAALTGAMIGFVMALLAVLFVCRKFEFAPVTAMLLIMAMGYALVYYLQAKYFPYHLLPTALFSFLAVCTVLSRASMDASKNTYRETKQSIVYGAVICILSYQFFTAFDDHRPSMKNLAWAENLDQPTAIAITPSISFSFPLARKIEAQWIDRIHSQWVAHYGKTALDSPVTNAEDRRRYSQYRDWEIQRVAKLIAERRPDLVLQCISEKHLWISEAMLQQNPDLLNSYEIIAEEGIYRVWRRKDLNIAAQSN